MNKLSVVLTVSGLALLALPSCSLNRMPTTRADVPGVLASFETEPVAGGEDAADDPAIWVHPLDASRSLVLGTDKKKTMGGLYAYDLQGKVRFSVQDPGLNNVDVRQRVVLGGDTLDLAAATRRPDSTFAFYAVSGSGLRKVEGTPVKLSDPYGFCLGVDPRSHKAYAFNVGKNGEIAQYELRSEGEGRVSATWVRSLRIASQGEGCVADDATGALWVGEEDRGLWKFQFADLADSVGVLVDSVQGGRLKADVEGVALYASPEGKGYVLVSSQGDNSYAVYDRGAPHRYRGSFTVLPQNGGLGGTEETDGIEVVASPLGAAYPEGLFVAQDGFNEPRNQNFKAVDWRLIRSALGL